MILIITITVLMLAENVRMETCESIKQLPIIDIQTKVAVDIQKDCGNGTKPCVMKCCPENEVLFKLPHNDLGYLCKSQKVLSKEYSSTAIQSVLDYSTMKIHNDKEVSFFEDFRILYSDRFVNKPCTQFQFEAYLRENGTAYWYPGDGDSFMLESVAPDFCMDIILGLGSGAHGPVIKAFNAYHFRIDDPNSKINISSFLAYAGLVSAFFLLLVLVVHCLLKHMHQHPKGKLFMGFVFHLMLYFVYNVWYSFELLEEFENPTTTGTTMPACKWVSPIGYYLFVSSFFWLNAMCYEIWRKFRSIKLKSLNDKKKMCLYSAYAVGMPLLITGICVVIDQYGSDRVRPGFDICMHDNIDYIWKRLYVRLPTGLVVISNVVMWVLTVRNMRRMRVACTAHKDSTHTRKGEKLSNVYQKLFILMGVNWLIEIVVTPIPNFEDGVYYMVTVPNTLLGVWIFLATVCHKYTVIMLCRRFGVKNRWTQNVNTTQVSQIPSASRSKAYKNSG